MSVSIKTEHEIELMREAGHLLEKVHDGLIPYIKPGVSTKEIDRIGEQMIRDMGCIPNFLNYGGFPGSFCISLNDEVVHGIPSEEKIIQEGDLVKIDALLMFTPSTMARCFWASTFRTLPCWPLLSPALT